MASVLFAAPRPCGHCLCIRCRVGARARLRAFVIGLEDAGSRGQWETASRPCRIPGRRQAQPGRQSHPVNRIQAVRHHTVRAAEVDRSAGELRLAKVDRFPGELRAVEVDLTAGELCPPEADRSAGEPRGGEPDQPSGGSRTRRAAAAYVLLQVVAAALALWLSKHFQVARLSTTLVALAPKTSTTPTGPIKASSTPARYTRCRCRSAIWSRSPTSTYDDANDSAASSTSTILPPELGG